MKPHDGRVAIVTGAGGGLGREHALLLARQGARVGVNDLAPQAAEAVAAEIAALGGAAMAVAASVTDEKIEAVDLFPHRQRDGFAHGPGALAGPAHAGENRTRVLVFERQESKDVFAGRLSAMFGEQLVAAGCIDQRHPLVGIFFAVEQFMDTPVKRYSAGMRMRLAFATAAHIEPPIVVVDEVLAVGVRICGEWARHAQAEPACRTESPPLRTAPEPARRWEGAGLEFDADEHGLGLQDEAELGLNPAGLELA